MARFYLLPSRRSVGALYGDWLTRLFPGHAWSPEGACDLAEVVAATIMTQPDVYVIFRDDLPDEQTIPEALMNLFGAEAGDHIVDVAASALREGEPGRRWAIGDLASVA